MSMTISGCKEIKMDKTVNWVFSKAGCYIEQYNGVVMGVSKRGTLELPIGGVAPGEIGYKAAQRITYQLLGIEVKATEVVYKGEEFWLYKCEPSYEIETPWDIKPPDNSPYFRASIVNPHTQVDANGEEEIFPWDSYREWEILTYIFPFKEEYVVKAPRIYGGKTDE